MSCNFIELNLLPDSQSILLKLSECSIEDFLYLPEIEFSSFLGIGKRQKEFLAGRACAHEALKRCNVGQAATQFLSISDDRLPIWPTGVVGCISHSDYLALASVSCGSAVALGVDLEPLISNERAKDLREHILSKHELSLVKGKSLGEAVTLIFSVKECIYKALYPICRTFLDFFDVRVVKIDDQAIYVKIEKNLGLNYPDCEVLKVRYSYSLDHVICWLSIVAS